MREDPRSSPVANLRAEIARQQRRQRDLASVWGISEVGVSRRLTGRVALSADELVAAAAWLDIAPADLLAAS